MEKTNRYVGREPNTHTEWSHVCTAFAAERPWSKAFFFFKCTVCFRGTLDFFTCFAHASALSR